MKAHVAGPGNPPYWVAAHVGSTYVAIDICAVIKQNESEVGDNMFLVSDLLLYLEYMSVESETRHLWTYDKLRFT